MKNRLAFASLLLLAALVADPLLGQEVVVTGRVTHEDDGAPVVNATVSIAELGLSATTDNEGRFRLSVPAESVRGQIVELRVVAPRLQSKLARITLAPGELTQDFSLGFAFQQDVVVGSRAAGAASEKAVPVDVFTAEEIEEASGTMETNQILQKLTPSFNFPRPTIADGTDSVRPATLRNLGPDQLLVLVNGKRRHLSALVNINNSVGRGSSGVDLNAIPAAAIERIEVLRDGAAAQYGSDAIAGVINIVLKSGVNPLKLGLTAGTTTHSDGDLIDVNGNWGAPVGNGSVNITAEYRDRDETNRAGFDLRDQVALGDGGNNAVPQPNHHWGDSEATDMMAFLTANIPLSPDATTAFYVFGGWSRRDGSHGGFYRRALDARNQPNIYPLGFLPLIEPDVEDYSATAGVRGVVSNLFWDVSAQYGHNSFDFNLRNTLNTSLGPEIPPNKTTFFAGGLEFNHFLVNADVTREFLVGLAGPLNIAGGLEYRRENFQQHAGEPDSYRDGGFPTQSGGIAEIGAQVFPGFRPANVVDDDRDSYAVYLDFEADVVRSLRIGLAGRFEDYSDFGNTSDGKLTLRFQPIQPLVFRGAASTGFRAPSLSQANFSSVRTTFLPAGTPPVLTPFEVANFRVGSPEAVALGAVPLRPEESTNLSAGIVVNPIPALEFSADFWRIDIDDRIVLSGNFIGPAIRELLASFGGVNGASFFTNAIDTETEGFDLTGRYNWNLGNVGRLDVTAAYSKSETEIVRVSETPPQLAGFQEVLFDRIVRRLTVCGQPEDNLRLGADWQKDRLGFLVRTNRYGEYCSFTNPAEFDQTFSPEWVTDVEIAYTLKPLTFAVGAQNVFDNFPDRNIGTDANLTGPAGAQEAIFTYPRNSPFGMNGRFIYSRVSYTF
jgi:iron complex outermembrane receptor protein